MGHWHLTQTLLSYSHDAGVWREDDKYSQVSHTDKFTNADASVSTRLIRAVYANVISPLQASF